MSITICLKDSHKKLLLQSSSPGSAVLDNIESMFNIPKDKKLVGLIDSNGNLVKASSLKTRGVSGLLRAGEKYGLVLGNATEPVPQGPSERNPRTGTWNTTTVKGVSNQNGQLSKDSIRSPSSNLQHSSNAGSTSRQLFKATLHEIGDLDAFFSAARGEIEPNAPLFLVVVHSKEELHKISNPLPELPNKTKVYFYFIRGTQSERAHLSNPRSALFILGSDKQLVEFPLNSEGSLAPKLETYFMNRPGSTESNFQSNSGPIVSPIYISDSFPLAGLNRNAAYGYEPPHQQHSRGDFDPQAAVELRKLLKNYIHRKIILDSQFLQLAHFVACRANQSLLKKVFSFPTDFDRISALRKGYNKEKQLLAQSLVPETVEAVGLSLHSS